MKIPKPVLTAVISCLAIPGGVRAQQLKPQTVYDFECYVQSAEDRMASRRAFLVADENPAMKDQVLRGRIVTAAVAGSNPRKVAGGLLFDWIGTVFIPGATVDRTLRMLRDYDHRAQYFSDVVATSRLMCRTGDTHFGYSMRLKEPTVIDADSDVVWEKVDDRRWKCRSYSTKVREVEKEKGYLLRLYTYWRLAAAENGVFVEGEAIELSGEFGSMTRALGSLFLGISPEKSLRRSLTSMRETMRKPGLEFADNANGPRCGEPYRPAGCTTRTER